MKKLLIQAIAERIQTVTGLSAKSFIYSPNLDLNTITRPFAVVRSITDIKEVISFDSKKKADFYCWVYVYPQSIEYQAIDLPETIRDALFTELSVVSGGVTYKTMPIDITVNRLNGIENDLEKYGSVVTCIYKIYS